MADFEVIGEAADGRELLDLLNKVTPDMVILDISMPNLRGIEAIEEIKTVHPEAKILMLTMHSDKEYLYQAIAAGADGYFLKKGRAHRTLLGDREDSPGKDLCLSRPFRGHGRRLGTDPPGVSETHSDDPGR